MRRQPFSPLLIRSLAILCATVLLFGAVSETWAAPFAGSLQQQTYPALDDPDPAVRAETVQAIRRDGDAAAVPALIAHLEDPDQRVGLYIAQALVELAPARVLPELHAALWTVNADGRWRAAYVLGERRDRASSLALASLLQDDEVLVVRTAAEALARIDTPLTADLLANGLRSVRPAEVNAVMNALLLLGNRAVPALAEALESGDTRLCGSALLVLEAIGTPEAMAALRCTAP